MKMPRLSWVIRLCSTVVVFVLSCDSTSFGQSPTTTIIGLDARANEVLVDGYVSPTGVETILTMTLPANADGKLNSAKFGWSASPCPAAVKIKFFRPRGVTRPDWGYSLAPLPSIFDFVTERGPFDVTTPVRDSPPISIQAVALDPPVDVKGGDVIAVTNLTSCGGPANLSNVRPSGYRPGYSLRTRGDVTSSIESASSQRDRWIFLSATGSTRSLGLLRNEFQITLTAVDPRSGASAEGTAISLGDRTGYFSLPEFTGDPTFPEVIVKMADARNVPVLGGGVWFFHAPLTDLHYILTVTWVLTSQVQTYSNGSASPGQLCGGVDTSAFHP